MQAFLTGKIPLKMLASLTLAVVLLLPAVPVSAEFMSTATATVESAVSIAEVRDTSTGTAFTELPDDLISLGEALILSGEVMEEGTGSGSTTILVEPPSIRSLGIGEPLTQNATTSASAIDPFGFALAEALTDGLFIVTNESASITYELDFSLTYLLGVETSAIGPESFATAISAVSLIFEIDGSFVDSVSDVLSVFGTDSDSLSGSSILTFSLEPGSTLSVSSVADAIADTAVIPEPASLNMMAVGLMGLAIAFRRSGGTIKN